MIREIDVADPEAALESAQGRMKVKVESAIKAIERGVGRVVFSDARAKHPIQRALDGEGTVVRAGAAVRQS